MSIDSKHSGRRRLEQTVQDRLSALIPLASCLGVAAVVLVIELL
jgi:hypothetical protein